MVLDLNDEGENSKADKNTEDVTVEAVSSILGAIGVKNPKVHSLLSVPFLIIKGKKKG